MDADGMLAGPSVRFPLAHNGLIDGSV